jgi:biopolymer transport protein ExbD
MQFRKRSRGSLGIDITPLIDVVFLLLIFFMVTTTFTWQSQLKIDLPEASAETKEAKSNIVRVSVDKEGNYYVNDKQLTNNQRGTLYKALKDLQSDKSLPLVITGDATAPHQAVVTVMDVAGQLGFSKVEITTQKAT